MAALAGSASAQLPSDGGADGPSSEAVAAYYALTLNPVGAFADVPHIRPGGQTRVGMRVLYGQVDEEGDITRRAFGVGADIPIGVATLGIIGGVQHFACPGKEDLGLFTIDYDCKQAVMGGATLNLPLMRSVTGDEGTGLSLGLQLTGGYGSGDEPVQVRMDDGANRETITFSMRGYSATIGVPMSVVARSGNFSIVPYVTPRFGFGNATLEIDDSEDRPDIEGEDTESDTRFMLGGGVGVYFQNGVALTLGFQKIFIEDGSAAIGLGVIWTR